jgi:hypothetical protein
MAAKLTRLTHRIAIQLHVVAESYIICSSISRRPVRKLLDTPRIWWQWNATSFVHGSFTVCSVMIPSRTDFLQWWTDVPFVWVVWETGGWEENWIIWTWKGWPQRSLYLLQWRTESSRSFSFITKSTASGIVHLDLLKEWAVLQMAEKSER